MEKLPDLKTLTSDEKDALIVGSVRVRL